MAYFSTWLHGNRVLETRFLTLTNKNKSEEHQNIREESRGKKKKNQKQKDQNIREESREKKKNQKQKERSRSEWVADPGRAQPRPREPRQREPRLRATQTAHAQAA